MNTKIYIDEQRLSCRNHYDNGYHEYAVNQYLQVLEIFIEQSKGKESLPTFKQVFKEIQSEAQSYADKGEEIVLNYLLKSGLIERFS